MSPIELIMVVAAYIAIIAIEQRLSGNEQNV